VHVDTPPVLSKQGTQVGVMSGTKAQQAREIMAEFVLREQSSESHRERLQRPQGAHLPRRCLACRAPREASKGGRMRAVLLSARRAKQAETLT
jgi:hypothetical protein